MNYEKQSVAVVGGGASGMIAAICAAKQQKGKVILFERQNRIGKKLLATGNGRCNLENENVTPYCYQSDSVKQLKEMLSTFSTNQILSFFKECGLLYHTDEEGRIYPFSNQATAVLDILRQELELLQVEIICECEIIEIDKQDNFFLLKNINGDKFYANKVILACGGKATPKLGGTDLGYKLAKSQKHTIVELYPCLTGMICEEKNFSSLKGVRAECIARLWNKTRFVCEYAGEVQFNDYGVSGYPIMQISSKLKNQKNYFLTLDLLPNLSEQEIKEILYKRKKKYSNFSVEILLNGLIHKKLAVFHLKQIFQELNISLKNITSKQIELLCNQLKYWTIPVSQVKNWDNVQVTGGGIALNEINPSTFESNKVRGLYLVGEMLDVAGMCGGFNLHWAFGSGMIAGINCLKEKQ